MGTNLWQHEDLRLDASCRRHRSVRGHCEICIAVMQAKERGEPHLCASFRHPTYYTTCVEVITSLLRADRALVYWIENGCIHNDPSQGPELVKPCPAHAVCGWVGNLYAKHPGEPFCPSDYRYRAPQSAFRRSNGRALAGRTCSEQRRFGA